MRTKKKSPAPGSRVRLISWTRAGPSAARLVRLGHVEQVLRHDHERGQADDHGEGHDSPDQVLELLASHGRLVYCCHIRTQCTSRLMLALIGCGSSLLAPHAGMIVPLCSSPVLPRQMQRQ